MTGDRGTKLSKLELASDWGFGSEPGIELPEISAGLGPIAALEGAIRPALTRDPCMVAFSGGRDSSVILALATRLARREGHPVPVPVTLQAQGYAPAEEGEWQRVVLDHLGIRSSERVPIGDSMGALGPVAVGLIERCGVQIDQPRFIAACASVAGGGALLTGFDGDEVFDPSGWGAITQVLAGRRRLSPGDLRSLIRATAPGGLGRFLYRRSLSRPGALEYPWLREDAQERLVRQLAADWSGAPLRFDGQLRWYVRQRNFLLHLEGMRKVGDASGVEVVSPLADRRFISALARAGGARGYGGRTESLMALFGDLLPERLLRRGDKGEYGGPYWGPEVAEFARGWDGGGVPDELVEVAELRRLWLSGKPLIASQPLLHAAWLSAGRNAI